MRNKYYLCALIIIFLFMAHKTKAQLSNDNYVMSETMLDSNGTSSYKTVQYYDGLGRPTQLADKGSGNGLSYVHTLVEYDPLGRTAVKWLPISNSTSSNLSTDLFSTAPSGFYGYSTTDYDALDRPIFISTPGQAWHDAGKGKTINYVTNGNDVKRFTITSSSSLNRSYYPACSLTGEETIDEDGHSIIVYKDLMGNIVLERRNSTNNTYYVYNDKCQLTYVLPPAIDSLSTSSVSSSLLDKYAYKYEYDEHGNCIRKKLPGCPYIEYWYDRYNRLAFMQDGRMRDEGKYRFYFYDTLSRLAVQGICDNIPSGISNLPANVDFEMGSSYVGQTGYKVKTGYNPTNPIIEIATYYDNYNFLSNSYVQSNFTGATTLINTEHSNATSLVTGQLIHTTNGEYLCSAMYYDERGNVAEKRETLLGGGNLCTTTHYTFTNKPDTIVETLTKNGVTRTVRLTNSYDRNTDKLATQNHNYNNDCNVTIAIYGYDELGRVNSVKRHGTSILNTYDYNIHGWTTNIHSEHPSSHTLLFDEQIRYTDGQGTPYYNGNISSTKYITYDHPMGPNTFYAYKYNYDGLNRLTKASYGYGPTNYPAYVDYNMLDEEVTYDANSNITSLIRHGAYGDGVVDNLIYSYYGNKVYSIHDSAPTVLSEGFYDFKDNKMVVPNAPEYGYDGCGSITYDLNKGITHIDYDYSGNPTRIQFADYNVTEYVYSADGRRLKSIHRTAVPQSSRLSLGATHILTTSEVFSVDSTEYINDFEFKNGTLNMCKFDGGYLAAPFNRYSYRYYITDHLGNNSLVVNGNGSVQQATHYYPFGSIHHSSTNQGNQKYKYNGKEYDSMHGLNEYDYGARQYDPAIGMFTSMDPLCEKYYHISPYAYCGGNPVNRVDPDGRDVWSLYKNGNIVWTEQSSSHQLVALDEKGRKTENILTINDRTILDMLSCKSAEDNLNYAVSSSEDIGNIFLFVSNNSDVEWKLQGFKLDNKSVYVIGTNHKADEVTGLLGEKGEFLEKNLKFDIHSHPSVNDNVKGASGADTPKLGLYGDMKVITNRYYRMKNSLPPHYVYHRKSKSLTQYTPWNSSIHTTVIGNYSSLNLRKLINN